MILRSEMDLGTLLPLTRRLLGYSIAKQADGATIPLAPIAHQLACLAGFKDEKASPTVRGGDSYLGLLSVGFLVAADERDMVFILEATLGMEWVVTDSTQRGTQAALITGTLAQWKRAVRAACKPSTATAVRQTYNAVYRQLSDQSLRPLFGDLREHKQTDQTFLLLEG
jgi:hypothetical protein